MRLGRIPTHMGHACIAACLMPILSCVCTDSLDFIHFTIFITSSSSTYSSSCSSSPCSLLPFPSTPLHPCAYVRQMSLSTTLCTIIMYTRDGIVDITARRGSKSTLQVMLYRKREESGGEWGGRDGGEGRVATAPLTPYESD